ncbi:MAG: hypothetical protein JJU19_00260 [Pararhodobacter sp.]|nr:hypothetical protein [Pararhodobacter sp.]
MSFYNPAAMRGLQMLFRLGFDRLWFAVAVIVSLAIAAQAAELLLHWLVPIPI